LRQNPANAVLHAGHSNGIVTLWSPATSNYLVKMQCHKGAAITALAVDLEGRTMVTGGMDRQIKVWDLRMYQTRHAYFCSAGVPASLDLSQRGLLAVGHAGHVTVWSAEAILHRKVQAPYMHHALGPAGDNRAQGPVDSVRFRPFEDVLGIGHGNGVSSIVIPGSGEPTLDTYEYHANPLQDAKQRREAEVRALLDKLSLDMNSIDADFVGGMEESDPASRLERLQDLQEAANANPRQPKKQKTKKRGRSKIQTKLRRKNKNIIDQNTLKLREAKEQKQASRGKNASYKPDGWNSSKESAPAALERFF
jgi:U3 small nucleolar RNA-associated protein 7